MAKRRNKPRAASKQNVRSSGVAPKNRQPWDLGGQSGATRIDAGEREGAGRTGADVPREENLRRWDLDGESGTTPVRRRPPARGADTIPDLVVPGAMSSNADTIPAGRRRREALQRRERDKPAMVLEPRAATPAENKRATLDWRPFQEQLGRELERAGREAVEVGVLLIDIDYFDLISAHYGADEAGRLTADLEQLCRQGLAAAQCLGRCAPGSLALFFVDSDRNRIRRSGERLLAMVRAEMAFGAGCAMTASIGCAFSGESATPSPEHLLAVARQRLKEAVHCGGDRLVATGAFD